jgi:hypothetical protein
MLTSRREGRGGRPDSRSILSKLDFNEGRKQMKRVMVLVGIVASFVLGATIRSRSVQAQLGGNSVHIDRVHAIVYGENPPVQIHGEVVGFSCASKHDPKTIGEVDCFILTK